MLTVPHSPSGQANGLDELLEGEGLGQEEVHATLQRLALRGSIGTTAHPDDQLTVRNLNSTNYL